jgi:hypothetical protein
MNEMQLKHRWQGPRLAWSRLIWFLVFAVTLGTFAYSLPYHYTLLTTPCQGEACILVQPTPSIVQQLEALGLSVQWYAGFYLFLPITIVLAYCGFAVLLIWRRHEDPSVWFFSLILLLVGTFITPSTDALAEINVFWAYHVNLFSSFMWVGVALLFYTFPDGRFVPTWSWLGVLAWIGVRASAFLPRSSPLAYANWSTPVEVIIISGIFITCIGAQIYRYRRVSSPFQRQQTKWIVFGLLLIALVLFVANFADNESSEAYTSATLVWEELIGGLIGLLIFLTLPLTLTIAILRYRLWDIDLIIRRTLIYSTLSITMALVYFAGVALLQQALGALIADSSELAVVGSTLAIAVLFNPLRHRVQALIDRRFYRRKYDAEHVLAGFSATARSEVELDRLATHLATTVEETLQPATISIWLRNPPRRVRG